MHPETVASYAARKGVSRRTVIDWIHREVVVATRRGTGKHEGWLIIEERFDPALIENQALPTGQSLNGSTRLGETVASYAARKGVSHTTVINWIHRKLLVATRQGTGKTEAWLIIEEHFDQTLTNARLPTGQNLEGSLPETITHFAARKGVNRSTVFRWIQRGVVVATRRGTGKREAWLIIEERFDQTLAANQAVTSATLPSGETLKGSSMLPETVTSYAARKGVSRTTVLDWIHKKLLVATRRGTGKYERWMIIGERFDQAKADNQTLMNATLKRLTEAIHIYEQAATTGKFPKREPEPTKPSKASKQAMTDNEIIQAAVDLLGSSDHEIRVALFDNRKETLAMLQAYGVPIKKTWV